MQLTAFIHSQFEMRLTKIHVQGDYEAWVKFFLTGVIEMAQEAVHIARNIVMLREQDLKKINALGQ